MPVRSLSDIPQPAPQPEERDGFKFRSGRLALDLPATLAFRLKAEPKDLLATPKDLDRWLMAAGLAPDRAAGTEVDLLAARELRESLYHLAWACIHDGPFAAQDLAVVNRWAAEPLPIPQLGAQGLTWSGKDVRTCLAAVARDGVELFGGPLAPRVRNCANIGCAILFVDTSRAGRRRWCSMSACGNKAKVGAFRQRQRKDHAQDEPIDKPPGHD
jgi:predicted RNA-binding Zn ribbon-like protein